MVGIRGLEKTSMIDYPGRMAAVIFLGGCNFRCPFCHNRELVLNPEGIESISEGEVLDFLEGRREWLDGVVVSGGEPCLYGDLPGFLGKIKELGYPVKLDTNGTNPGMLKELMENGLVDFVAMDIKGPESGYERICGASVDFQKIRESIGLIISSGIEHEFRSTVLPAMHTKEDVEEMARLLKGARRFYLQQFRPKNTLDPDFEKEKPFSEKEMLELRDACRQYVETDIR